MNQPATVDAHRAGEQLLARHRETLSGAIDAIGARGYWFAFEEHPKAYGEDADAAARAAFEALLGKPFPLDQPATKSWGGERSPYDYDLGITYPLADVLEGLDVLVGPETLIDRGLQAGAVGAISSLAARSPTSSPRSSSIRRPEGAERAGAVREALQSFPFHAASKAVLRRRGVPVREDVRRPLRGLDEAVAVTLARMVDDVLATAIPLTHR